jgi:hypothetical protein
VGRLFRIRDIVVDALSSDLKAATPATPKARK